MKLKKKQKKNNKNKTKTKKKQTNKQQNKTIHQIENNAAESQSVGGIDNTLSVSPTEGQGYGYDTKLHLKVRFQFWIFGGVESALIITPRFNLTQSGVVPVRNPKGEESALVITLRFNLTQSGVVPVRNPKGEEMLKD